MLLAFPVLALLVSGCATPALWQQTASRVWRPQSFPDQFLATTTTGRLDVVVVFRQSATINGKPRDRLVAWNLRDAPVELTVGRKALLQLTNVCEQVQPMPVFTPDNLPADATSMPPGYAVLDWSWSRFTVYLQGAPSGPFELPVSHEKCRAFVRLAGMPFAIAADAALVGLLALGGAAH
jgi:hypothetical protein